MLSLDYASLHLIASFFAALATLFLTYAFIPAGFELQSSRAAIVFCFGLIGPITLAYRRLIYERTTVSRGRETWSLSGSRTDFDAFSAECVRLGMRMPLLHAGSAARSTSPSRSVLDSISESELQVEAIVMKESGKDLPPDVPMKLVQLYFDGTPTYTLEIFHQVYWRKIPLYRINPIWLFQEGFKVAREPVFERIKRSLRHRALRSSASVLSAPVVAAAAVAIKLDDGGPVFFLQTRVGRHKAPFKLIKLRTMRARRRRIGPLHAAGRRRGSPGSGGSCARPGSTSCRSFGTCSGAR